MEAILEKLIESPRLVLYQQTINEVLDAEQIRREHFIETIPDTGKNEFINGQVVVQAPGQLNEVLASKHLFLLLDCYVDSRNLGFAGCEKLLISLTRNDYEPDICFFRREVSDAFTPKQMRFPAPDFIVEILSDSTSVRDRGVKFDDYAAHGVAEYWIIDPEEEVVEQYFLDGDHYRLAYKVGSGTLTSRVVTGFEIPVRAIFDADVKLAALRQLLQ
jgi:Uma2 family endonuclease